MTLQEIEQEIARLDGQITACKAARQATCREYHGSSLTTSWRSCGVSPFGKLEVLAE